MCMANRVDVMYHIHTTLCFSSPSHLDYPFLLSTLPDRLSLCPINFSSPLTVRSTVG